MKPIRAFIAFSLPEPVIAHLRILQKSLRDAGLDDLRFVRPENIHLTLRFLGDVDPSAVDAIAGAMAEAAAEAAPLSLTARGIGAFPAVRKARVVWAGLAGETAELISFRGRVAEALETMGYPREPRRFTAHLTLARVRERRRVEPERLVSAMESLNALTSPSFSAGELVLFQSDPKPNGAVYTPLRRAPLGG
ncbi:MAG: RNA 2',3'-cyclic phosphodiesterase [Desulfococcaceae bacterium]